MTPTIAPPPRKKTPVWVWVLAGVAGCVVLVVMSFIALGLFALNKVAEVAQNPRQLAALVSKLDPDLEVMDVDESKKTIRVRNKRKDEEVTISLDDLREGKLRVTKEGRDGVESLELGGKLNLPNWVPKFPGVEPRSLGAAQSDTRGEGGAFTFTTTVSREKIVAFYRDGLEKRGLAVKASTGDQALAMSSEDGALHATVTIQEPGDERRVTVFYGEKRP